MSAADVDLDRLAEFAAGLLDSTQAAEVGRLVAEEPAWADALAALTAAQPLVRSALAELGSPPVPDDVVARLDAALAAAAPDADVVDLSQRRAARRPRWSRLAAAATAVAAGVAVCVGGVALLRNQSQSGTTSGSAGSGITAENGKAAAPALGSGSGPVILHTGRDYTPQTLPLLPGDARSFSGGSVRTPNTQQAAPGVAADLSAGLQACLGLLAVTYQATPTLVDYARFRGKPAIVVVLSGAGSSRIVVVGTACGTAASGTDQIYP